MSICIALARIHSIFWEICSWHIFFSTAGRFNLVYGVLLCDHTTGCEAYFYNRWIHGIFKVRTNLAVCCTHQEGSAETSLHKSQRDRNKWSLTLPRQGQTQGLQIKMLTLQPLSYIPCHSGIDQMLHLLQPAHIFRHAMQWYPWHRRR